MSIYILIILGLAAGWLASRFLGSSRPGMLADLLAGVVGASIAGFLAARLLPGGTAGFGVPGVAIALLGASVLIAAARVLAGATDLAGTVMFWRKPTVVRLPESVRLLLAQERGVSTQAAGGLRMMQERGIYSGRRVTYFQVFDPATVAPPGTDLRRLDRLDARGILHSGFIEHDGRVVLNGLTGERGSRGKAWPGGVGTP